MITRNGFITELHYTHRFDTTFICRTVYRALNRTDTTHQAIYRSFVIIILHKTIARSRGLKTHKHDDTTTRDLNTKSIIGRHRHVRPQPLDNNRQQFIHAPISYNNRTQRRHKHHQIQHHTDLTRTRQHFGIYTAICQDYLTHQQKNICALATSKNVDNSYVTCRTHERESFNIKFLMSRTYTETYRPCARPHQHTVVLLR